MELDLIWFDGISKSNNFCDSCDDKTEEIDESDSLVATLEYYDESVSLDLPGNSLFSKIDETNKSETVQNTCEGIDESNLFIVNINNVDVSCKLFSNFFSNFSKNALPKA